MPLNHKKCRPRLEELVLLPPRRCLAPAAKQAWDHCPPFQLLAPPSTTTGLCGQSRTGQKAEPSPSEKNILPCCAGQAWSCLTAPCPPHGLCSLKTKPRSHTPVSQSPCAWLGPGDATRRVATGVPQHPLQWEQEDGEVRKVQTRYSPAKTPDWSHWQHIPPRQALGRWRTCTKRETEV